MKDKNVTYVDKSGKRPDGRKVGDHRKITIDVGVIDNADGSAYIEWGHNKAIAAVYGPRDVKPARFADPFKALVKFYYRMAPFSVSDRKRPAPGRREHEISKVCGEAFESAILTHKFPNSQIDIYVNMFDSDAGSRTAAITAASVALADAGIPMKDMVTACAVGKAGGHLMVDLVYDEEAADDAVDMAYAVMPNSMETTLLQMDAKPPDYLSPKEVKECFKLVEPAIKSIYEIQKNALKKKYQEGSK